MARFVLEPIGELALKGRAAAVSAWRVRAGRQPAATRRVALVGRDGEAARLRQPPTTCWPGAASRCF